MRVVKIICVVGVLMGGVACGKEPNPAAAPSSAPSVQATAPIVSPPAAASVQPAAVAASKPPSPAATSKTAPVAAKPAAASATPKAAAGMSGKAILEAKCVSCHDMSQITGEPRASDDWAPILDRMVSFGAVLSPAERKSLEAYLVESYSH